MHYTQNPELKTSEFALRHIVQIPRFSNSEFSISHYTQTQNSELKTSAKVYQSNDFVHCPGGGGSLIFGTGVLMSSNFLRPPNNQTIFFKETK